MNRPNNKSLTKTKKRYKRKPRKQTKRKRKNINYVNSVAKDILAAAMFNFASSLINAFVIPIIPKEQKKLVTPIQHLKKDKDGVYKP